jgi:poly(A) polymerase
VLSQDAPPPLRATPTVRRQALHRLGVERYVDLMRLAAAEERSGDAGAALTEALAESARWQPKPLPITGHDVMGLGVPAGPAVGQVLAKVEDWWVTQDFRPGHAACLAKAQAFLRDPGHLGRPSP